MAFLQKTWKDRVAEYINRRVLTKEDGTTELVSVERSEGTISQEGDAFSAANMNDLEQRIANEFSEQNKKIDNPYDYSKKEKITTLDTVGGSYTVPKRGKVILYVAGHQNIMLNYLLYINSVRIGCRGYVPNDRHIWCAEFSVKAGDLIELTNCENLYESQNYFVPYE